MRRTGKHYTHNLIKEAALDAGKTVIVCTKDTTTIQRRKKHLTMIETLQKLQWSVDFHNRKKRFACNHKPRGNWR